MHSITLKGQSTEVPPLPGLINENGKFTLLVDGEPFIILGAQTWNSSAWPDIMDDIWPQLNTLHCNTLEVPIYWEQIEPEPGKFNFENIDYLIREARKRDIRLVFLWFASYKNGSMDYTPEWVKTNPDKYGRMHDAHGNQLDVLSALDEDNLEADKQAFVEVMRHIKEVDRHHKTVIMMQPENEPGSQGTNRDYAPRANEAYNKQVPGNLTNALNKNPGTWEAVFGVDAPEAFNAYHIARYINEITKAGKAVYNLPMYANAWIRENRFERPGEYPSGGPTSNMLDIWKAAAPDIDLLAVDIYHQNYMTFRELCKKYKWENNPLFIPEMGNGINFARFQFYAIGEYDAIGVAPYGIDPFHLAPNDKRNKEELDAKFADIAANYRLLGPAIPVINELQGTSKLKVAVEESGLNYQLLHFDNYDVLMEFGYPTYKEEGRLSGRAMIANVASDEFLIMGFDTKFTFRPSYGSGYSKAEYVTIEQGTYENGKWKKIRNWNGDAAYHSTLPEDGAILKIKLRRAASGQDMENVPNFEK